MTRDLVLLMGVAGLTAGLLCACGSSGDGAAPGAFETPDPAARAPSPGHSPDDTETSVPRSTTDPATPTPPGYLPPVQPEDYLALTITPDPTAMAATPEEFAEMLAQGMILFDDTGSMEYEVLGYAEVYPVDAEKLGLPAAAVERAHVPDIAVVFVARAAGVDVAYVLMVADRITGGHEFLQGDDPQALLDLLP